VSSIKSLRLVRPFATWKPENKFKLDKTNLIWIPIITSPSRRRRQKAAVNSKALHWLRMRILSLGFCWLALARRREKTQTIWLRNQVVGFELTLIEMYSKLFFYFRHSVASHWRILQKDYREKWHRAPAHQSNGNQPPSYIIFKQSIYQVCPFIKDAGRIRPSLNRKRSLLPVILEVPSKTARYDPEADPVMRLARTYQHAGEG
jgi:hypothetical protein